MNVEFAIIRNDNPKQVHNLASPEASITVLAMFSGTLETVLVKKVSDLLRSLAGTKILLAVELKDSVSAFGKYLEACTALFLLQLGSTSVSLAVFRDFQDRLT